MTTVVSTEVQLTVGVDTHADTSLQLWFTWAGSWQPSPVPTTPAGYRTLAAWAGSLGAVERFGIEGTR